MPLALLADTELSEQGIEHLFRGIAADQTIERGSCQSQILSGDQQFRSGIDLVEAGSGLQRALLLSAVETDPVDGRQDPPSPID